MNDHTFIKDSSLLEEDHRVEDLLDFSANINDLTEQLVRIKKNSMVGLIGPYGCGKSTLLYQIHRDGKYNKDIAKDKNSGKEESVNDKYNADAGENDSDLDEANNYDNEEKADDKDNADVGESARNLAQVRDAMWFTFDAWKYPDRKDLWDGFVIDIAMQISGDAHTEVKKKIEGTENNESIADLEATTTAIQWLPVFGGLIGGMNKILIEGLASSPVKRVYEFHNLLKKMFSRIGKDIYIVVEDIDRSGDQGIFFLETLRHFIKNIEGEHKIIVIVPMGEEVFRNQDNNMARDSYLKVLDYQLKFNPGDIKFDKFIQETIEVEKFVTKYQGDPSAHAEILFYFFGHAILANREGTIRDIKHLLRLADSNYSILKESDNEKIEPMLVLFFTASEYFHTKNGRAERYYFENISYDASSTRGMINMQQISVIHSKQWLYDLIRFYFNMAGSEVLDRNFNESKDNHRHLCLRFIESCEISKRVDCNRESFISQAVGHQADVTAIDLSHKYLKLIPGYLMQEVDEEDEPPTE